MGLGADVQGRRDAQLHLPAPRHSIKGGSGTFGFTQLARRDPRDGDALRRPAQGPAATADQKHRGGCCWDACDIFKAHVARLKGRRARQTTRRWTASARS